MGSAPNTHNAKAQQLFDALTERTKHQYKSYYGRYIKWCEENKLISKSLNENEIFEKLPLSSMLFHCFLLDLYISKDSNDNNDKITTTNDDKENLIAENIGVKLSTLKKIISSLKFLVRVCTVYNNENVSKVDDKYLENITKLHSSWYDFIENINNTINLTNTYPPLLRVSMNMWNPQTINLNEKVFKTTSEKLKFLIDFHFTNYLNLSYSERAELKLSDLTTNNEKNIIEINKPNDPSQMNPMVLLPQDCPFLCPLTSLAASLFLRFYGIKNVYKGDGFPDVSKISKPSQSDYDKEAKLSANVVHWQDLPLIRGKSPLDYPKDVTMSSYYNMIFRYCHLPYKRREYFQDRQEVFPKWNKQEFEEESHQYESIAKQFFKYNVPHDFITILNHKSPYNSFESLSKNFTNEEQLPSHLLVQLFPEIGYFKNSADNLNKEALEFIKVIEALRNTLLKNLPYLYHFFPHHDLFNDTILTSPEFQKYFKEVIGKVQISNGVKLPFELLPGYDNFTENDLYNILVEPPFRTSNNSSGQLVTLAATSDINQNGTVPDNGKKLIDGLQTIFNNINIDEESKKLAIKQLKSLGKSISIETEPVQKSIHYVKNENHATNGDNIIGDVKKAPSIGLLDLDSSSDEESGNNFSNNDRNFGNKKVNPKINYDEREDESDDGDDNLQEEMRFMINELVGEKLRSTMKENMDRFEEKVEKMITTMVERKVNDIVKEQLDAFKEEFMKYQKKRPIGDVEKDNSHNISTDKIEEPEVKKTTLNKKMTRYESITDEKNNKTIFKINPSITSIEDIIYEWFTPNPSMDNECIHSMNKKFGKNWRTEFESVYKQKKIIIELYIYLVNQVGYENIKAVHMIETLSEQVYNKDTSTYSRYEILAQYLKSWKRKHNNSFEGLKLLPIV
ncbi:hypothetical protein TPHA_0D03320 [Tetrapisispora phaffii CBS 4417]|uniref:Transcription activator GCR1-like domain-containing protein n=1 Tax=Tetrapisispora phaffii (strain ATCC 24235 / CBS 4417 / NBRC 1672 / NRRL Y-8282 / UCD 70-5) TaxID=1071381 RepID=G8BSZ7_TETPH|nr:hypothetical protein TPHA_0D03320 [Tetrapisispora phaffii CBS 4417]CCE62968.1 hypothetical protein TPHA_0D03320 [Tetrapisispora phaffii CBS 4417]